MTRLPGRHGQHPRGRRNVRHPRGLRSRRGQPRSIEARPARRGDAEPPNVRMETSK